MTSDAGQLVQERVAGLSAWIDATPGICNGGRSLCCEDLEALGWRRVAATDAGTVEEIRAVMAASGVTPFVAEFSVGCREPVRTIILRDGTGRVVATALGHRAHRPASRFRDYLFAGAVAVAPAHRGRGLGRYVNALMATRVLHERLASRRVVEASGLRRDPGVLAAAVSAGKAKFTR